MSLNKIVVGCRNQLKQNYRSRYYGNRGQAIPDLKPGDNAVSFVNHYLNVTVSNSDSEDHVESNISRRLLSEGRLRIQKDGANILSSKSRVQNTPHRSQEKTNSNEAFSSLQKKSKNMKASLISSTTAERLSPKVSEAPAPSTVVNSSEEEFEIEDLSDINESSILKIPVKTKCIQTDANKKERVNRIVKVTVHEFPSKPVNLEPNNLMPSNTEGNENLAPKDYSSSDEEGIKQQPISQHAALKEGSEEQAASFQVTHLPQVAGEDSENEDNTLSGSLNNLEQLQPRRKSPRKRDQRAEQTYGLLDETFSIKNRKEKNSYEAFSSLQKKSKNMKASLISSTTAERLSPKVSEAPAPSTVVNSSEEEFEIEDLSDINESSILKIPVKTKCIQTDANKKERVNRIVKVTVHEFPSKPVNLEPNNLMPSNTEGNENLAPKDYSSSDEEGIKQQPISQHAALKEGSEEQAASFQVTHLPQVAGEDSENEDNTLSGSLNNLEQLQPRRKSPRKRDQRAEQTYGLLDETFSIKNRKGRTSLQVVEIPSGLQKKCKNVTVSPICSTMAKRLSPKVFEAPPPSTVVNSSEEEFEIEDITDKIELKLFTIPEMAKSMHTVVEKKELKVTVQKLPIKPVNFGPNYPVMPSNTEGNEHFLQNDSLTPDVKGIEQKPALREGSEEQAASSQAAHLQEVAGEDSEDEDSIPLLVPIEESDIDNTGSGGSNNIEQVQQLQERRKSQRKKSRPHADQTYWLLEETFSIKNMREKPKNKRAGDKKKKNSKQLEEEQKNQLGKEKKGIKNVAEKTTQKSNKQRKSSKAKQNEKECTKDYMSNDNEAEEVKDTSATRRTSRKRNSTGEMLNADKKKNVQTIVCRQPDHQRIEMNNFDGQQTEEEMRIPTKKRYAKLRNNRPSYPADHTSEESVFQSGPVIRQRAVRLFGPGKPIAYDLDAPDIESGAEDDPPIAASEEEREHSKQCPLILDPETGSDAFLECIAQSETSRFFGDGSCKYWTNFSNSIFTTGKLIIAPKKKSNRSVSPSDIVIYYVEKGKVQLNLHKTERVLKDGDFFYVPPKNSCTIANLQDKEAVLVFNRIKILPLPTH